MLATLALIASPILIAPQGSTCLAPTLSFDAGGQRTERVALIGSTAYTLQGTAGGGHSIDIRGALRAGSRPAFLGSISGTPLLAAPATRFAGLTADAKGVQAIVADPFSGRAVVAEWSQDGMGGWTENSILLSGTSLADGDNLAFDGRRWAALSYGSSNDVFVDLIVRGATGKLVITETLPLAVSQATAPDRPTGLALDGRLLAVRVTADTNGGTFLLEDVPGSGWTLDALLPELFQDAQPTTAAIALEGGTLAVARDLGTSFEQHVVLVYSRNPVLGSGWSPIALLELPGATVPGLDRRNVSDVEVSDGRIWVAQGSSAGVTAYDQELSTGGYAPKGAIRGLGGPIAITGDWVAGRTSTGSAFASSQPFKLCTGLFVR